MTKKTASISISGRMTLNMHSLNNEGGEGNQIITRQLTIIGEDGAEHTVNGISGETYTCRTSYKYCKRKKITALFKLQNRKSKQIIERRRFGSTFFR